MRIISPKVGDLQSMERLVKIVRRISAADKPLEKSPFKKWSGWGDLNSRPLAPQASALARLRYTPNH